VVQELGGESTAAETETGSGELAAGTTDNCQESQSEKAKLRRRVREFLESEANIDPPRAQTKADWRRLVRQECGDRVTDYLFETVWRQAEVPAGWRAPGRRT